jgi:hypothetical protein
MILYRISYDSRTVADIIQDTFSKIDIKKTDPLELDDIAVGRVRSLGIYIFIDSPKIDFVIDMENKNPSLEQYRNMVHKFNRNNKIESILP